MPTRRTASLLIINLSRSALLAISDTHQVISVDPVKLARGGIRVGFGHDELKKRGLGSFRADIACELIKAHHLSTSCCSARSALTPKPEKLEEEP
jgi:hypothetical protein